jgi:hypothetical protein
MRRPGTDENNVRMADVVCDFCHREWTEAMPMIEGHQGSCICGNCLKLAYRELVLQGTDPSPEGDWKCPMCLEADADRAAMDRADEPGWPSPLHPEVVVCRRCIAMAAGVLHKDPDYDWTMPTE